jgi:hypothetical protein
LKLHRNDCIFYISCLSFIRYGEEKEKAKAEWAFRQAAMIFEHNRSNTQLVSISEDATSPEVRIRSKVCLNVLAIN